MKRLLSILIAMFAVALCSLSCEDAGDYLSPELSEGEISADAPEVKTITPGYERAQIEWTLNNAAGTTVSTCFIYDGDNVYELDYEDCYDSADEVWRTLLPLSEGSHSLTIKSYDSSKTLSGASASTIVYVYGESFAGDLANRLLKTSVYDDSAQQYTLTFIEEDLPAVKSVDVIYPSTSSTIYSSIEKYKGEDVVVRDTVSVANETSLVIELPNAYNIDVDTDAGSGASSKGAIRGESIEIRTNYLLSDLVEGALEDEIIVSINKSLGEEITSVHVTTLRQLIEYMSAGITNHNITMTPGTYSVTADNIYDYAQVVSVTATDDAVLLHVAGNYNYYDLTGVTIEISTGVPPAIRNYTAGGFSGSEFHALHVTGRGNTVKGLTMIDVGSVYDDIGGSGYQNVVMDGAENVFEDIYTFSQGSKPYGYGEVFGKGAPTVISHNKHSAWLIRGDFNVMRGCTVVHHAYGHFIFTQGGWSPTIENCYVYGEMTNTDTICAEQGTGSDADNVDFYTYFNYFLTDIPKAGNNYAVGLGEGGVREYASGNTIIDGVCWGTGSSDEDDSADDVGGDSDSTISYRDTSDTSTCSTGGNITVRNILLYQTRGNISFVLGGGNTYISNITAIGNQGGLGLKSSSGYKGSNDNRGFRGTVEYGPVMSYAYGSRDGSDNKGIYCEVTVIPSTVEERVANNGSGNAVDIKCQGNHLVLDADPTYQYDDKPGIPHPIFGNQLIAAMGGLMQVLGQFPETLDEEAYNCTLDNTTEFPVQMSPHAHGCTLIQNGNNTTLVYGGTNASSVDCLEQASSSSEVGTTIYEGIVYNSKVATGNTVTINGNGDTYIYGNGNTVTVNGYGDVYVLGNSNTITAPSASQIKLASAITSHAYAKYPYASGTFPGYEPGYVGTLTFNPTSNKINGSSQSGTAEVYQGGDDYKY